MGEYIEVDAFTEVLLESSSRGNQPKFYNDGYWYKLDSWRCYEGLAEEFVSLFESCIYDFNYVPYESCRVMYNGTICTGCFSSNMYGDGMEFISLRNLFRQYGMDLGQFIRSDSIMENIKFVVDAVGRVTGLDILWYLRDLLFLDCIIINEDRHYMNLGVCRGSNRYVIAQCFDNGCSLFCTNWTYRGNRSITDNISCSRSVARPFSKFYDKQLDALISLGCKPLVIDKGAVDYLLSNYYNNLYSDSMNLRVRSVLREMLSTYEGRAFIWG